MAFLGIPIKASPIVKAWVITASVLIGETKYSFLKRKKKEKINLTSRLCFTHSLTSVPM